MNEVSKLPAEHYRLSRRQRRYEKWKRAGDLTVSLLALALLLIPFGLIALGQKLSSPEEPVFFTQRRFGRGGHLFYVTKFRSMKSAVNHYLPTGQAELDESSMTRFGRFLRDTSIDELPQLFQVVSGKMSLVGPRPLIPQEREIHRMRRAAGIYQLRPGITGWAQINGRDYVNDEEKLAFDKEYLEGMSFAMDMKILWRTVKAVVKRENIL